MALILCVIGTTGSGKSTLIEECFPKPLWITASPGKMIRQSIGMSPAKDEVNPNRWDITEDLVRNYVLNLLEIACDLRRPLVLDGFPRDRQQAEWFFPKAAVHGASLLVLPERSKLEMDDRHKWSIKNVDEVVETADKFGIKIENVEVPWIA